MAYRVDLSLPALADAEDAYLWIKYRSPESAGDWYEGLMQVVFSLENFPARCVIAPESEELGIEVRQLLYGNKSNLYRILFSIEEEEITAMQVVRIWRIWSASRRRPYADELREGAEEIKPEG